MIWVRYAKKFDITRKKFETTYKESDPELKKFLKELEKLISEYGKDNIYHQDESGFDEYFHRKYGYSLRGTKIHTQNSANIDDRQILEKALDNFKDCFKLEV